MAKKKTTKKAAKKVAPKKANKKVAKKATKKVEKKTAKKVTKKATPKKVEKKKVVKSTRPTSKKAAPKKAAKKAAPVVVKKSVAIHPYLTFDGNCETAFHFYQSVFGGKFPYVGRFGEMPPMPGMEMPESEKNKIMHMSLPIGNNSILMGSDSSEAFGHVTNYGNNFSISISTTSEKEADKLYNALSAGGMQTMPIAKTFWGSYFGMLVDKFGIQWQVSFDANEPM